MESPDFADEVSVSGRVGLDHVLDVVRLQRLLEAAAGGHVLQLQCRSDRGGEEMGGGGVKAEEEDSACFCVGFAVLPRSSTYPTYGTALGTAKPA